ncbi:gliding motility-associated C-terminal domain-containing protein [Arenibacter nanhaiticus]|uniref:Gliding motility-associated C-terminal domain-containing protein n=1 Tax=Arenibacter nanhaiticus TaxID=558155 RepID=A0A1M6H6L9_9FLAO|nr:gliding motility-associated C-terminal domain-containing protein [Arenibacter nanhaiticus]SHJ17868.1 gliding motility-associated C-terminal domain-containing protein [Arenibacter nanhaiticus]
MHVHILLLLFALNLQAQTALFNSGNIRIHDQGQIGFHTNLINNASFDQNLGLAGFYGNNSITISGAFIPIFYDTEISNDKGVLLDTGVSTVNNTNFIIGNFITPRPQQDLYYNFMEDAFYVGENGSSKIAGYAAVNNQQNFTFPIGDDEQLRPLILNSNDTNTFAKCAYYFESAASPPSFPQIFDLSKKPRTIGEISSTEFWHLEGTIPSTVSISWNARSNIAAITGDAMNIIPVGWSITGRTWVNLGVTALSGDLAMGFLTSDSFIPNDYAIITFASVATPKEILTLDNYLVTPNSDGINDWLYIPELELSNDDTLRIYDRNGLLVYSENNYTNGFTGFANSDNIIVNRKIGLPSGVYFYLIAMKDLNLNYQGFLYLKR